MKRTFLYSALLCSVIVQMTLLDSAKLFSVRPDLVLLLLTAVCVYFPLGQALLFGIICGMVKDIFSSQPLALQTIVLPLWSIVLWKLARKVSVDDRFLLAGFILLFILAHNLVTGLVMAFLASAAPAGICMRIALLEAVYTAAVAAAFYRPLKRLILL